MYWYVFMIGLAHRFGASTGGIGMYCARILVCICSYSVVVYVFVTYLSVLRFLVLLLQTRIEVCIGMYSNVFVSIGSFRHVLILKY